MFAAEKEVRRWREEVERRSSLSPREIDELEDHLRARVELEMELEPALGPARALAIARGELVRAVDLSREFARAGKSTWRRWMAAGWAMAARSEVMKLNVTSPSLFGVSFALPVGWAGSSALRVRSVWRLDSWLSSGLPASLAWFSA